LVVEITEGLACRWALLAGDGGDIGLGPLEPQSGIKNVIPYLNLYLLA